MLSIDIKFQHFEHLFGIPGSRFGVRLIVDLVEIWMFRHQKSFYALYTDIYTSNNDV